MVVGAAPAMPTVPASFGTNESGAATPGPTTRHAPAGASPVAKRPSGRQIAPVPLAPGRDMIAAELIHCLEQLTAQSQMDQVWLGQLHEELGVDVYHISTHSVKMVGRPARNAWRSGMPCENSRRSIQAFLRSVLEFFAWRSAYGVPAWRSGVPGIPWRSSILFQSWRSRVAFLAPTPEHKKRSEL